MEEILSLALYLLVLTFLTLLNFSRPKPKPRNRIPAASWTARKWKKDTFENEQSMKKGTQIAYIPTHAEGDENHPDVELGFIVQVVQIGYRENDLAYFCRFWRKGKPGELRTTANSERCYDYQLKEHESVSQEVVDETLKRLGYAI